MDQHEIEVTPSTCVYGGDALARLPDGRAVFIPFALPGELCRIRLIEEKQRYARAELLEVVDASPLRIAPRCRHFQECGGCHYQQLAYQDQLRIKQGILIDQLVRVGKINNPPVGAPIPSPQEWNYRNHVQFHLSETGQLGFQQLRSNTVVPIQECHLPEESLNSIWPALDLEYIPGLERVSLRSGDGGEDVLIVFESSGPELVEFSVDLPISAVLHGPDDEIVLAGDEFTVIPVHDFPFVVSAGAFFQVNTRMAELLVDHLLASLPLEENSRALDVYSGVGLFSHFLAPRVKELIAIESDPAAGEDFLYNLSDQENVLFYNDLAEDVISRLDPEPDVVLLDPPRSGLSRKVLDGVAALDPGIIAYISCDPATLGRDAARFASQGYFLAESRFFDMFPQTFHIESVNIFQRSNREV